MLERRVGLHSRAIAAFSDRDPASKEICRYKIVSWQIVGH